MIQTAGISLQFYLFAYFQKAAAKASLEAHRVQSVANSENTMTEENPSKKPRLDDECLMPPPPPPPPPVASKSKKPPKQQPVTESPMQQLLGSHFGGIGKKLKKISENSKKKVLVGYDIATRYNVIEPVYKMATDVIYK